MLRNGIYRTFDNNAAYVPAPNSLRAFDLDQREWIPITEVRPTRLRDADPEDRRQAASCRYYPQSWLLPT